MSTARTTAATQRWTCDELGVCQSLSRDCEQGVCQRVIANGLRPGGYYFAPGTLQALPRKRFRVSASAVNVITAAALAVAGVAAMAAAIGFSAGWLT